MYNNNQPVRLRLGVAQVEQFSSFVKVEGSTTEVGARCLDIILINFQLRIQTHAHAHAHAHAKFINPTRNQIDFIFAQNCDTREIILTSLCIFMRKLPFFCRYKSFRQDVQNASAAMYVL